MSCDFSNKVDLRDTDVDCHLQYQYSDIRVYTKFYTVHERRDVYMRGGKVEVFADITGYVRHLIQTGNRDVVKFEDGMLQGVGPGKTTVKVTLLFYVAFRTLRIGKVMIKNSCQLVSR